MHDYVWKETGYSGHPLKKNQSPEVEVLDFTIHLLAMF